MPELARLEVRITRVCLILAAVAFGQSASTAEEILTPVEAAKHELKGTVVTVEFEVRSGHPVLPDGKHVRVFSEASFRNDQTFVINLTPKVVEGFKTEDLSDDLLGRKVRATGKVGPIIFSSFGETRPGIYVDDPANFKVLAEPVRP